MINKILVLCLLFTVCLIQAQKPVSIHLLSEQGLPDKEFYDILGDEKGFIWLAAHKGLFRYDGKVFKKYNETNQRGLSVFNLQQDNLERIWCNNISGQFYYVENNKMYLFIDLSKELKGELADFIVKKDYLWVFLSSRILQVNLKTKSVDLIHKSISPNGLPFKLNETIYLGRADSILKISSKNKITSLLATKLSDVDENNQRISEGKPIVFKIGNSFIYKQKRKGLNTFFEFDVVEKKLNKINGFTELAKEKIYNQFENRNEIWFATSSGVWIYELINNTFKLKKRFLTNSISKIFKDKEDNYWFTTLNNGIYVVPNIYIETRNLKNENNDITCLDVINDRTLVFGNTKGEIIFYDIVTNKEKTINLPIDDKVSRLKYHPNNNLIYISTSRYGFVLNYKTSQLTQIKNFSTAKSLTIIDNDDLLFTNYKSVSVLEKGDFKRDIKKIVDNKRTYASHYKAKKQTTYIAYVDDLVVYDSLWKGETIRYKNKPIYGNSITETTNGVLWVATFKDGVFGIKNNKVTHHYTTINGLTSNNIVRVKADENNLWIVLDNSIQALDVTTNSIKTLTKRDGVLSYDISGIEFLSNKVFLSSSEGLFSIDKQEGFKTQNPEVYFNTLEINERDITITSNYTLKYNQNAIKIGFNINGFLYSQKGQYKYRLKGFNNKWIITDVGINSVKYNSLPVGDYTFQVQPVLENKTDVSKIKELQFLIKKPFWETWWFILGISALVLGSVILYFKNKIKNKEKERIIQLEKISLEKELINLNLTALRSQMNPHFIFNALNSIQDLILKQDTDASYDYIVMFAQLVRNTLSYSNQDFIPVEKELEFLNVYLQLEKLRFGDAFNYDIHFDDKENLEVPSLLVQPFIENALVHGLLHKAGEKKLNIVFNFKKHTLQCIITDNGIGRKKAREIAVRQGNHHESFALNAIEKRLEIFKKQYNQNIGYIIEDLYENETSTGTKVILTMPFKKRF